MNNRYIVLKKNNIAKKIIFIFLLIMNQIMIHAVADSFVNEIHCNGLQRISLDTISFNLPIKIGSTINQENIAECIKILFSTGYFEKIAISNCNGVVVITVKEYPIINAINIYKNKTIKSEIVQKVLDAKNIKSGNPLNNYSIFKVKQELQDICHSLGKLNATIQIIIIPLTRNRANIKVIFSEGSFTKISKVNIFGNRFFSRKQLFKQLTFYNPVKWKNIVLHKTYQNQKLFHDLEKLRTFYLNHGYAKFRIDDIQTDLTLDKKNMCVSIYITEGIQYFLKSVVIHGNILHHIPNITEYIKIKPEKLYSDAKIKEIEHNIRYVLGKLGYIQPDISIEYIYDDHNRTITIYIYVDAGSRFYIREIQFEGNDITKDFVIRRELKQMEQTPLNYIRVLKDQKQLQYFSYFKTIDTRIKYIPDLTNQVDLIYKIKERNTGNLNVSVGFGTESGLNMQISIHQENLLGTGNTMSMTAIKNKYQIYIDALMLKKYIGVKKINVSGKIFYNNFIHNKIDLSNYNIKNYGIDFFYSYPFTIYQSHDMGVNYNFNHLSQIEPQIAIWRYLYSVGLDPLMMNNHKDLNSNINFCVHDILLVTAWTFNNLNRMYFPEYGSHVNIKSNITLPGSSNNYYKIVFDGKHYLPLDKYSKWVCIHTIYTGYVNGFYNQKESPFYDNFYIGGIETVRGFRLNSIGPKAAYYICNDSDTNYSTCSVKNSSDAVGGNAIALVKSELMIPILSYINTSEYFDTARVFLFMDAGTVWDTHWKNTKMTQVAGIVDYSIFKHIRVSTGISLKWISPIGPIIFSYSKLIKKYSGDIEEPFQFNIGKSW